MMLVLPFAARSAKTDITGILTFRDLITNECNECLLHQVPVQFVQKNSHKPQTHFRFPTFFQEFKKKHFSVVSFL